MRKLLRFYNQNRIQIFIGIIALIFFIMIKQAVNNYYKTVNENANIVINQNVTTNNDNEQMKNPILSDRILNNKEESDTKVIDEFIKYCNNGDVEKAYQLISDDCKKDMFPTLERFINNYYKSIFDKQKIYNVQSWITSTYGDTYKIRIEEDIMSLGKIDENAVEDYFTIVEDNKEIKLNINSFITKKEINKEINKENIKITLLSKTIYMDKEFYNIKIQNNTGKEIKIDSKESTKSIYIMDNNDVKYFSYQHEITDDMLIIENNFSKEFNIAFSKSYSPNRKTEKLVFSDIISDYEKYLKIDNKSDYNNRLKLDIEV